MSTIASEKFNGTAGSQSEEVDELVEHPASCRTRFSKA